jgi:uncharacterized protein
MKPDIKVEVRVIADVLPSEDPHKVAMAVSQVLGGTEVPSGESRVEFASSDLGSLTRLRDQLRDRHVRAAARRALVNGREGDTSTVMLNRQAAATGVLVICGDPEESPLGPIYLNIRSKNLDAAIDWLTA